MFHLVGVFLFCFVGRFVLFSQQNHRTIKEKLIILNGFQRGEKYYLKKFSKSLHANFQLFILIAFQKKTLDLLLSYNPQGQGREFVHCALSFSMEDLHNPLTVFSIYFHSLPGGRKN